MNEIDDYWQAKIGPLEEELKHARWFAKNVVMAMAPVLHGAGLGVDAKPTEVVNLIEKLRMDYGWLKGRSADLISAGQLLQNALDEAGCDAALEERDALARAMHQLDLREAL